MQPHHGKRSSRPTFTSFLLVLVAILVLAITGVLGWIESKTRSGLLTISETVLSTIDSLDNTWTSHWQNVRAMERLRNVENENNRLKIAYWLAQATHQENNALRELLAFGYQTPVTNISSTRIIYTISRDGLQTSWVRIPESVALLLREEENLNNLLSPSIVAVGSHGLAGKLYEREGNIARFQPLGANGSIIDVVVGKENTRAIAIGSGNLAEMKLKFVARGSPINLGDIVWSGGLDAVVPPKIPLGIVQNIVANTGVYEDITVKLYQDGTNLQYVWLLYNAGLAN